MSTSATEDRVSRARELGLPTNLEEAGSSVEMQTKASSHSQTAVPKDNSLSLGRCDKKQYEHCGPHPRYADIGQGLPPFACVNWKPEPSVPITQEPRLKADEVILREAILDVIDGGWKCSNGCDLKHSWQFPTEAFAGDDMPGNEDIEQRLNFVDAVEKRIRELQSSSFSLGIKLENYCSRHIRVRLPEASVSVCADCAVELEKRRINDPD